MVTESARAGALPRRPLPLAQAVRAAATARARPLAYLLPTLLAAIVVQSWFIPGTVIAYGDIPPPIAPTPDYQSLWNVAFSGEGTPSYEIVQLPYYESMRAMTALGLHQGTFQRIWLTVIFAGLAAAIVYFAFAFTRSPLAAGVAGVLGTLNPFTLVNGANPVPLVATAVGALLAGLLVRACLSEHQRPRALSFALVTLGLSYAFVNPPHVLLVAMLLGGSYAVACLAGGADAAKRGAAYLARAAPIALVLNLWWIVPALLTVTSDDFQRRFAALDVVGWEWTHVRSSLLNALTLNTTWGWDHLEYFPFAERLDRLPFALLKVCLPLLALLGLLLARGRRERRVALGLAGFGLVTVWIVKGLHPPLRDVNLWLYDHAPGYWLLRDPSKALLMLSLVFAVLGGIAVARLGERIRWRSVGLVAGAALVLGSVAYVHPLATGGVVGDQRPLLPGNHVRVPDAWPALGAFLNARSREGKVAILPTQDFYQLPTTWGYYGVSFSRYVVGRGVFEAGIEPGSYFRPAPGVSATLASIEDDLLEGDASAVTTKLRVLGADYLVIRHDLDQTFPNRRFAKPEALERGVGRVPSLQLLRSFGLFNVYRVTGKRSGEVFAAAALPYVGPDAWIPSALELRHESALVTGRAEAAGLVDGGTAMRVFRSQRGLLRVAVRLAGSRLLVRLTDPMRVTLANRPLDPLPSRTLAFRNVRLPALVTVGSRGFRLDGRYRSWTDLGFAAVPAGLAVRVWRPGKEVERPLAAGEPRLLDCELNPARERTLSQLGISAITFRSQGTRGLRLRARSHSACVALRVPSELARTPIFVSFQHRGVRGNPPRFCAWQDGPDRCAEAPGLSTLPGWQRFESSIVPDPDNLRLSLFLYADGLPFPGTQTEYRAFAYRPYELVGSRRLRVADLAQVGVATFAAGRRSLDLRTRVPKEPSLAIEAPGRLYDCHRSDERNPAEAGLSLDVLPAPGSPVLRLSALTHAACTILPIEPFDPAARYRVRIEYRTVRGDTARACLWQVGSNRCAPLTPLERAPGWKRLVATVKPDFGTVGMQLFLYADGHKYGWRRTVVEYRNLSAVPVTPVALLGEPRGTTLPRTSYTRVSPSEFRIRVEGATAPFLLVVDDSFSSGWRVDKDGRSVSDLAHVMVNGYANGWLIPWRGAYELRVYYFPERIARAARRVDLALVPLAFLLWLTGLDRRLAQRLRRRPRGASTSGSAG